ncbi:MAG: SLC13 family permease [Pirellulaceae bacterium]
MRSPRLQMILLVSGVGVAMLIGLSCAWLGLNPEACWSAATGNASASGWWILNVPPTMATALLPFVVFPITGVLDHREVAASYGHTMILLLLGGFLLSAAMERSGAHRRLAVGLVRAVGGRGERRLVLGFMLATAMLSMWISNTATTLMMLLIALAVLERHCDDKLHSIVAGDRLRGVD